MLMWTCVEVDGVVTYTIFVARLVGRIWIGAF